MNDIPIRQDMRSILMPSVYNTCQFFMMLYYENSLK